MKELLQRDRPGVVRVDGRLAELLELGGLPQVFASPLLCDVLTVGLRELHRVLDEDGRDDVQHGHLDEEYEDQEEDLVPGARQLDHVVEVDPVVAAGRRHVKGQHRIANVGELRELIFGDMLGLLPVLGRFPQVIRHALDEDQAKYVEDEGEHDEAPEEREHGPHHGVQQEAELRDESEHADHAKDPGQPQHAHGAHEGEAGAARVVVDLDVRVVRGEEHKQHVEDVPPRLGVPEEVQPVHPHLQDQLENVERQEPEVHCDEVEVMLLEHVRDLVVRRDDLEAGVREDGHGHEDGELLAVHNLGGPTCALRLLQVPEPVEEAKRPVHEAAAAPLQHHRLEAKMEDPLRDVLPLVVEGGGQRLQLQHLLAQRP
mmetsp:Transcript_30941/g.81953  ORF Transcript_30941/g.81953 Transcript_30941/m.81953 type:complete len:372 (-) Transcript_30941:789-1904(-)